MTDVHSAIMHSRAVGLHVKLLEREFAIASDFKYCRASGERTNYGEIFRTRLLRLEKQHLWLGMGRPFGIRQIDQWQDVSRDFAPRILSTHLAREVGARRKDVRAWQRIRSSLRV